MKQALFVSMSGPDPGVFDSQVLDYGNFMRTLGIEFRYLLYEGFQAWRRSRDQIASALEGIRERYGVRIGIDYVLRPLSSLGLWQAESKLLAQARELAKSEAAVLIQARGVEAAWIAARVKRSLPSAVVIYDARADAAAEARLEARHCQGARARRWWEKRAQKLDLLEAEAARGADHILAVSGPLKERLLAVARIPAQGVSVVPCCIDPRRFSLDLDSREATRARLGLGDSKVVIYAGSLSIWQIPERIAEVAERLCQASQAIHLLVLTRETDAAHRYFERLIRSRRCTVLSCPYEEVGQYLNAGDLGLLLREVDPVNRVASPVKFAEYQSCGLPVVVTPGIGDVTDYVRVTGFGAVLDLGEDAPRQISDIAQSLLAGRWESLRSSIRERARGTFSREQYRPTYESILHRLGLTGEDSTAVAR